MQSTFSAVAFTLVSFFAVSMSAAQATHQDRLDLRNRNKINLQFRQLIDLANRHDLKSLHDMFWQSPSALLVAKSAKPSEGDWAGFWGNDGIDQKLHDIAASGPVVLAADYPRLKVVGLTSDVAESYAPVSITVSYAGQDGTPKPFLIIINWIKVQKDWKVAAEIILPVPAGPALREQIEDHDAK
jgi:hypothetical protein